ncbi:serine/threonine-protein kinase [Cryptosporangium arvum]|uniref:non-specific serine/threonine protein kinase n=1 Tax=Cryptosporangium arvum DSM 44712 TaxID=927661 RepID=A0A010YGB3_9ACTN|nr:serine/threonine-protein kinase [Cryptosporangium arvum]EXG79250.1 serine/threonine protein kinase [Cryptosporangium arvum DSM 44712]
MEIAFPVPGYTMLSVLGSGGFSTVYRALQESIGREVAVKIDHRILLDEADRARFRAEVRAAGQVSGHPNVIDIHDAGITVDGRAYLVMELCPAGSLADYLRQHGPLPPDRVLDIGVAIADALAAAHRYGVVHRDVKPANVLYDRYGHPELADFGLAARYDPTTESMSTLEVLTPAYAAPEMFWSRRPTPAVDVYGLSATLYALLSGRPPRWPLAEANPTDAEIAALHSAPIPGIEGVPDAVITVLRAGMAREPEKRLPTAGALRDALRAARDTVGNSTDRISDPGAPGADHDLADQPTARLPRLRPIVRGES